MCIKTSKGSNHFEQGVQGEGHRVTTRDCLLHQVYSPDQGVHIISHINGVTKAQARPPPSNTDNRLISVCTQDVLRGGKRMGGVEGGGRRMVVVVSTRKR